MFNKSITDADKFVDLSTESQALYFHLGMKADDEGFVAGPYKMLRMLNLKKERLTELTDGEFIYLFASGICVIRHWHIHNKLRKDRVNETIYQKEKNTVAIDSRGVYVLADEVDESAQQKDAKNSVTDKCLTDDGQMSAQERVEQDRKDKISTEQGGRAVSAMQTKLQKLLDDPETKFPYKLTTKALTEYTKQMEFECIAYAIDEANINGKHSLGYVRAVLDRLLREGIKTREQLIKNRHGPSGKHDVNRGVLSHNYTQKDFDDMLERFEEL